MHETDGPLVVIGVQYEKALVVPLTLLVELMVRVDGVCANMNILMEEAETATKH
ncbi:hypothetical protein HL667_06350 [Bradyrhizobium sp. 83012]|uniref:Uncharacterized protein n=1 Tax=Bradyrhizobium aeschynomenes TaxID=2734909 RepID=A0ABX2C992_9BRAD|nr:hypothetical protein [Bradyrhizobium aeschynomenes]NPU64613.1 hypothetical protein [Bradyrhizobium aeschynomenes]